MPTLPTLGSLAALLGAAPPAEPGRVVEHITDDTRTLDARRPGALFVALAGARDGHDFVPEALLRGAIGAVVRRGFAPEGVPRGSLLAVDDTARAHPMLAGDWRRRHTATVVCVTGSAGKTSTKELLRHALATAGTTLATPGNQNEERGVPATLLRLAPEHRFLVLELGMRGPGQIRALAAIARPEVGVLTNVGEAHLGRLGSRAAVARAKCELLEELAPGGVAVLPAADASLVALARELWRGRVVTFGLGAGDVQGELRAPGELVVEGERFALPLPGAHQARNFLAALAVARVLDIPWAPLRALDVELPGGRGRRLELPAGAVLLDESYNAAPDSMRAVLRALAAEPARRRLAVLGSMRELGPESLALHREMGALVAALGLDRLYVLDDGPDAAALAEAAAPVPTERFASDPELARALASALGPGDVVVVKGARAVGLERVVAALAAP
ncbi:MAG: UDP-N-acetylmuramoyl-tripeptide--D-alanyl-D-alanine ligase [Polyangiaceae bacterium]|nr:UDP-N-acetylmuramoyl-tripeptide--D-alanyl-D-alanine ligase [Polyangiaceae bacterium]